MKAYPNIKEVLMKKKSKTIITLTILGMLAFLSSNTLLYQYTGNKISLLGTLLSIPTFFLYLFIHTSVFNKEKK